MVDRLLQLLPVCAVAALVILGAGPLRAAELTDRDIGALSKLAVTGTVEQKDVAVKMLLDRGKPDIVPSLIFAMRFRRDNRVIPEALSSLTGAKITGWQSGMLWQEAHPEVNSPLKKALLTGFHSTAKHNATKAVSPSSETMRTI